MFIHLLLILIANTGRIFAKFASDLPSGFPKCSANDPNFKQCTTKAANDARPFLVNGIPELGVPSVDPLFVTQVVLKSGSQAVNVEVVLSNNTVRGLGRYVVSNLEIDFDKNEIRVVAMIDYVTLDGNFTLNGRILLAELSSSGQYHSSLNNTEISAIQKFDIVTLNNEQYIKPINITGKMTKTEDPKINFFDVTGGNAELEQLELRVINENQDVLFDELKPSIAKIILEVITDAILKPIDLHVPISKFFANY